MNMLKYRIIPILLLQNGRLVKTIQFDRYRDVGDPVKTAMIYDAQRADELVFLDIEASEENRGTLLNLVRQVSSECFMPLAVGGGIRTVDEIRLLLQSGADKVVINTAAVERPDFITEAADIYGSANIVVSIDVRQSAGRYEVYTHGGKLATDWEPVAWAAEAGRRGAGEILITSIDRDGMMMGLDIPLIRSVADAVRVPVIGAGGVAKIDDFQHAYDDGHAAAVGAGSIFHFTDQSIIKTRRHLVNQGVNVRW